MARSIDSDYIDFSKIGGFNMGISFDGFEENVKKFMELPIKYLDSAHDKAVELIEDVHAILYAPFTDDEVPDKEDECSCCVITEPSQTSAGTELVGPNDEASSPPASPIALENNSHGCVDTDAHQTESFSTKSTDSSEEVILWNPETSIKPPRSRELTTITQDDHATHALETDKVTEQVGLHCSAYSELTTIPQDDHATQALETDKVTEQVGLHCSAHSDSSVCSGVIPLGNSSADHEEEMLLHSTNGPTGVTVQDFTAICQDDFVPQALHLKQVTEQAGLNYFGYSDTLVSSADFFDALLLEDSSANFEEQMVSYSANVPVEATTQGTCISHNSDTDESSCVEDPSMLTDNTVKFVDIDLGNDQEHMTNDEIEVSSVPKHRNASFKKMIMRNLSRKLRWSKKQANAHQAMPSGWQDSEDLGYQLVSSSDDLEDGWEVV